MRILRTRHHWGWKDVRRRLTGPTGRWQPIAADGIELRKIAKIPVTRYRYRGNTIPDPWAPVNARRQNPWRARCPKTGREQSRHRAPDLLSDESGQGLRPPKGRTWRRRDWTPVVKVTGGSNKRVSLAALIAIKPGHPPRLIYRVHHRRRRDNDQRKGFTETGYARLFDAVRTSSSPARLWSYGTT